MAESTISKAIVKWLNTQPNTRAMKLHGNAFQSRGEPDILCVHDGRAFFFETKLPGKNPTDLQAHRIFQWQQSGAVALVVRSLDDVKQAMELYK